MKKNSVAKEMKQSFEQELDNCKNSMQTHDNTCQVTNQLKMIYSHWFADKIKKILFQSHKKFSIPGKKKHGFLLHVFGSTTSNFFPILWRWH